MRIWIPMLPPRECNPNYHGRVRARIRATKTWRDAAYLVAVGARNNGSGDELPYERAEVHVLFVIPNVSYERDPDNARAGLKHAIDGLVQAGVLGGDRKAHYHVDDDNISYKVDSFQAPATVICLQEYEE